MGSKIEAEVPGMIEPDCVDGLGKVGRLSPGLIPLPVVLGRTPKLEPVLQGLVGVGRGEGANGGLANVDVDVDGDGTNPELLVVPMLDPGTEG